MEDSPREGHAVELDEPFLTLYQPQDEEALDEADDFFREMDEIVAQIDEEYDEAEENSRFTSTLIPTKLRLRLQSLVNSPPFTLFICLLVLADMIFLVIELIGGDDRGDEKKGTFGLDLATQLIVVCYFLDMCIRMTIATPAVYFMGRHKIANTFEFIIIVLSLVVETMELIDKDLIRSAGVVPSNILRALRVIRAIRVLLLIRRQAKMATATARRIVSADRRRLVEGGWDIDLTYITDKIMATSWPSTSVEALYRNHIDDVAEFLDTKHKDQYKLFNCCAEREYDATKFHNRVERWRMDDHNPCNIEMLYAFCQAVEQWYSEHPDNKIVVHCKGGKGRTGTALCTWLMYSGQCETADEAMKRFGFTRTSDSATSFQGVESSSQARYLEYVERCLTENRNSGGALPERLTSGTRILKVKALRIYSPPTSVVDWTQFHWLILAGSSNKMIYASSRGVRFKQQDPVWGDERPESLQKPCQFPPPYPTPNVTTSVTESGTVVVSFNVENVPLLLGDVRVQFFHKPDNYVQKNSIFQFWFNTHFVLDLKMKLEATEVDKAQANKKGHFDHGKFCIAMDFEDVQQPVTPLKPSEFKLDCPLNPKKPKKRHSKNPTMADPNLFKDTKL